MAKTIDEINDNLISSRIENFLKISKEWYWEIDSNLNVVYASQTIDDILGFHVSQVLGSSFISLLSVQDENLKQARHFIKNRLQRGEEINDVVACFSNRNLQPTYLEITAKPLFEKDGKLSGYQGLCRDISKQYHLENTLHNLADGISASTGDSFFRSLVKHIAKLLKVDYALVGEFVGENKELVNVIVVQARGKIESDFSYPLMGTPCEEVFRGEVSCYTENVQQYFPEDGMLPDMNAMAYLGAPLLKSDKSVNGILAIIHSESFENTDYLLSVFRLYVSRAAAELERKQVNQRLEHLAHYDELTGLCNRSLLMTLLNSSVNRARRTGRKVVVFFLDLDRFKNINDSMGHDVGDMLLKEVANRLKKSVRADDVVARLSGDEFVIVLNDLSRVSDSNQVVVNIIEHLSSPLILHEKEVSITTSMGISVFPEDGQDSTSLLKHADIALYRAKDKGRDGYQYYSSDMGEEISKKIALEHDLKSALKKNQFEIYFQPKICGDSNRVVGVEALLRWHHPEHGTITPDIFIPLLEEIGKIGEIGDWVLENAVRKCQQWNQHLEKPICMAVNLSAKQFHQGDIFSKIKSILSTHQFSPSLLEIEITESILIEEGDEIVESLKDLRSSGVGIALDDFGTGYSSLSYLQRFPISSLKIDRSFIKDIASDKEALRLTQAIVTLANSLDLEVVAEGVETVQQKDVLDKLDCHTYQGFYFARPMPENEFYSTLLT